MGFLIGITLVLSAVTLLGVGYNIISYQFAFWLLMVGYIADRTLLVYYYQKGMEEREYDDED